MSHPKPAPGPSGPLTLEEIRGAPLDFLSKMRAHYGDVVEYSTGDWRAVLISHPEHVRHVLVDNVRNYRKEGTPDLRMLKPMLGNGLLTSDGEIWREQRHILAPLFRRQMVEAFGPLITRAAAALRARWLETANRPLELGSEMSRLTLGIAAEALFGHDVSRDAGAFSAAVDVLNEAIGGLAPQDSAASYRFAGALAVIHDVVERAIAARRRDGKRSADALSLMLGARNDAGKAAMTDRQLLDQSVTLLLAGHETTAKALTWTFYLLARHPAAEDRLRREIATLAGRAPSVADLPALPFCAALLRESMRLYTPIWIVSRIAIDDDEVGGYRVPAGALVPISPYLIHRHESFWADAERFDPARFMPNHAAEFHPQQFVPFGAGPRHCIGQHFATMEMQLVLATLVQGCCLSPLSSDEATPEALVTLRPRGGLWMTVARRDS
jgi:enediyne biosynthesis protein E7